MKKIINTVLPILIYTFVRLLRATYRFRFVGLENKEKAIESSRSKSYIMSMWHQTIIPGLMSHMGDKHFIMYSQSKDGDLITFTADRFGYHSVRGSSNRGGKAAKEGMIKALAMGNNGAITPDGPKGPPKVLKRGVIEMGQKSGCAVLPLCLEIDNFHEFKSWDLCQFPLPFSKIMVAFGEPVFIPKNITDEEFENYRQKVTEEMEKGKKLAIEAMKDFNKHGKGPRLS